MKVTTEIAGALGAIIVGALFAWLTPDPTNTAALSPCPCCKQQEVRCTCGDHCQCGSVGECLANKTDQGN